MCCSSVIGFLSLYIVGCFCFVSISSQYSAAHVRRNDLQYKESFVAAGKTLNNISPLLTKAEPLYMATDETNEQFFATIRAVHPVYQWKDFFTPKGGSVLQGVDVPSKLVV